MANKRKRTPKEAPNDNLPSQKRSKKETPVPNGSTTKTKASKVQEKPAPFTEHPTVEDRKRELALYTQLGSEDQNERIEAATIIIAGLLEGDGVEEPTLFRHLAGRLFRGLASGRNASRLGFSLVLTEILGQLFGEKYLAGSKYSGLTFDKVLGILVEKTDAGGSGNGQEERDHYFGQLFGIECFVRAGILFTDKSRWEAVLNLVLKLSQKKSWLKSQCGWIIVQAISQMDVELAEETLQRLTDEGVAKTPEGVGIWIAALDRFPDMKVPKQPWRSPLEAGFLTSLPAVLKDSGRDTSNDQAGNKKQKQGNWTAQLHFVWNLILAHFLKLGQKDKSNAAEQFKQFWKRVVDEGFFSKTSSDSQKFSGFMIFQRMLEGAAGQTFIVESVFSQNLMTCLMNQAAKEDRYLHRAATKALKGIEATVERDPSLLPTILRQLLSHNGVYNFDQRTNTKTVDKILQHATPETIKKVLKTLQLKDFSKSGLDETKYYQSLSSYLFRLSSVPSDEESTSSVSVPGSAIEVLTELAYSNQSVPASIKEALRTKTTSAFAKLVKRPEDFGHLCGAILSIKTDLDPEDEIGGAVLEAYEKLKDLLDPAKDIKDTKAPRQALALLYAVAILQFYNEDPDVMNLLEELEECYDKLAGDEDIQGGEGIAEFLVEILLAMVARPSSLMRQVSQQVFEAFTNLMSPEAIKLLTDPLAAEESAKGQQALFSTEDEDMANAEGSDDEHDHEEDGSHEELDSDVEIVNLEEAGSDDEPSDNDSDDENEDDDEEEPESENQEALDALDTALAEALGSHGLDKDADAPDTSDESDMSDSEMMEVDAKLAEIFKHRTKAANTNKKKEKKDAKETVINFKHRVLDLLAIFIKKEAAVANPLAFEVLLPLLELIRTTTTKPLANKACEMINNFSKSLKKAKSNFGDINEEQVDELVVTFQEVHLEAPKDGSHAFAKAASTASLAIASVLVAREKTDEVFELYADSQLKWFKGEIKIPPAFFSDWLNWCQSHASASAAATTTQE
ncbi:DNA polymerase phi-domain-containing protein [Pseudoneurospora amorphoporcata]|uniref:DNA polymerase phi-domain-containing protein n=1 Tax=Pseudoneurospora amorphoporcata TaxID=241081 RepID=A0AAN6NKY3_9PEZI|nr:DNA polymerase phi-domain-containing protein [Pseudoneurospora amorphoporcata]